MRQLKILFSCFTFALFLAQPAFADHGGVPGRREGGGTRWTAPKLKPNPTLLGKLSALTFASRLRLPLALRLKALYS